MLAIVDTGCANLASVAHALDRLGASYEITDVPERIAQARRVILPGVGSMPTAMRSLEDKGLVDILRGLCQPVLGICLGMQLLFETSEEGGRGLGVLAGRVGKLDVGDLPLPHMGWNRLENVHRDDLLKGIENGEYVYFVHSFAVPIGAVTLAACTYGQRFSAIVRRNNFYGCQFHPERSGKTGAKILTNFLELET